jgi:hypothetical protein
MVNGRAAERVMQADRAYAPPPPTPSGQTSDDELELSDTTGENPVPVPFSQPAAFRSTVPKAKDALAPNQCEYCGGVLPSNRDARFCPHCGQPREGELKCQGCGSELDVGWAYCLACGRPTGFE